MTPLGFDKDGYATFIVSDRNGTTVSKVHCSTLIASPEPIEDFIARELQVILEAAWNANTKKEVKRIKETEAK